MKPSGTNKHELVNWLLAALRESAWAPLSLFIFYLIGRSLQLFDLFPRLDIPTHFIGGVAITYFYRSTIRNSQGIVGAIPAAIQTLLAFTCTGTTIILWEFHEKLFDFFSALTWSVALRTRSWICSWACWARFSCQPFIAVVK